MAEIVSPHDAFFKQFLSRTEIAADFLDNHLPPEVAAVLELSALELQKDTFVDDQLREHFSDLLYRIPLKNGDAAAAFVYLLFEHKSYPDRAVAFQLLRYMVQMWDKMQREAGALSPIIPLVVYHGRTRWTISTEFAALLTMPDALVRFTPHFNFQLVDLSSLSDDEIRGQVWTRIFQLILKYSFDERLSERLPAILGLARELAQQASGLQMIVTILRYVSQTAPDMTTEAVQNALTAVFPPDGGVFMKTLAEQWIEQGIEQGREQGIGQGIEQGSAEAQRRITLRILERRFAISETERVTLAAKLATIRDLAVLAALVDHALDSVLLTDFKTKLQTYLNQMQES